MPDQPIPPEYADLTLDELLTLYGGDRRHLCPPELVDWLDCAERAAEIADQARRNAELEERLRGN